MKNITLKKLDLLLDKVGDIALKRRAKYIILGLDPRDGDKILDVGCGDGFYLHLLSNLGINLKLFGSDFDPNALKSAKIILREDKVKLFQGDLMKKLPFKDNSFDKIVMSEVVEHLPQDIKGLKEVYRVLKPGGVLCITVPNANYPLLWDPVNRLMEDFSGRHIKNGFWAGIWFGHIRLYKPDQIKKVVEKSGFNIESVKSLTWWCLPFNHNIINLAARVLYSGNLSETITQSASKYSKKSQKSLFVALGYGIFRLIDSLNEIYQPKKRGAGVFVKAIKKQ
jgi:ubiquinone/menaquinone biosynthesis C-methylase UbiE